MLERMFLSHHCRATCVTSILWISMAVLAAVCINALVEVAQASTCINGVICIR